MATFSPRIWHDLPVVGEGLTFRKRSDNDGNESDGEEPSDKVEAEFIFPSPDSTGQALEELGYSELCDPKAILCLAVDFDPWQ